MITHSTTETHTPGPWSAEAPPPDAYTDPDIRLDPEVKFWIVGGGVGEVLAQTLLTSQGQEAANARLFAAAPDLLAALKAMVASYDGVRDALTCATVINKLAAAESAIAKAEGAR